MDIAVDFDGTCVLHRYPEMGPDNPGAAEVLRKLAAKGHNIILYTMRGRQELVDAIKWFFDNGIRLYAVNTNPEQLTWTDSPKVHAQLYIDDHGVGCPLLFDGIRNYVDWDKINEILEKDNFFV